MRLVFVDMHRINFLTKTYSMLKVDDRIPKAKHRFLMDYAIGQGVEICDYVTGQGSCVRGWNRFVKLDKGKIMSSYEARYVLKKNFPGIDIRLLRNAREVHDDDIVIGYFFDSTTMDIFGTLPGHKVLMSNHFIAINNPFDLKKLGVEAFVSEINLENNGFVNRYIRHDEVKMITCPYIFADRFRNMHCERKNKLFAVGTLSTCKGNSGYRLYREMFKTEWIQPMRKEIFEKAGNYPEEIDSYISYIFEDKLTIRENEPFFSRCYKKLKNRSMGWTQKKYESFDMVEKFNEYLYFACPEELVGMPGIGFVEGMACGCAYIGIDADYYRDLGLISGKHFFTYDGTMEGLIERIHYCMQHTDEVIRVAEAGEKFVREHFNQAEVARGLFEDIKKLI